MGETFQRFVDTVRGSAEYQEGLEHLFPEEFFDIQLRFVSILRSKNPALSLEDALANYTCIHGRFGIGITPPGGPTHPLWREYVKRLRDEKGNELNHEALLKWTYEFYKKHQDRQLAPVVEEGKQQSEAFGWFWYDYIPSDHVAQLHFRKPDDASMLSLDFFAARKNDIAQMLRDIKKNHPDVVEMRGTSWLFGDKRLLAVARKFKLLPETFLKPIEGRAVRFAGFGTWGQFLDERYQIKPEIVEEFFARLEKIDFDHIAEAFPMRRTSVRASIQDFFDLYEIKE